MSAKGNRFFGTVPLSTDALPALLLILLAVSSISAELPGPYIADLDRASNVVVGTITAIEKAPNQSAYSGIATVQVREVLKGPALKTLNFAVEIEPPVTNPMTGSPSIVLGQSPGYHHRVGESGIWLVESHSIIPGGYGLVKEQHLENVKMALRLLETRKWSEPVNGLQAWAVLVSSSAQYSEQFWGFHASAASPPEIMLSVRNATASNLFVPSSDKFVTAVFTSASGVTTSLDFRRGIAADSYQVFCRKLAPGATTYLAGFERRGRKEEGTYLHLPDTLVPGKYTALLKCENDMPNGREPLQIPNVPAWTGSLKAPAIDFEITVQEALGSPSPQAREAAAKIARETFVPTPRSNWVSLTNDLRFGTAISNLAALLQKHDARMEKIVSLEDQDSWVLRLDDTWILRTSLSPQDGAHPFDQGRRMLMGWELNMEIESFPLSPTWGFNGLWNTYRANGQISTSQHYQNGKPDGPNSIYDSNGSKLREANSVDGH